MIRAPGVAFAEPVGSGGLEADEPFTAAGLVPLNEPPGYALDADTVRCWAKEGLSWPEPGDFGVLGDDAPAGEPQSTAALRAWP